MLEWVRRGGKSLMLLVGMYTGIATLEDIMERPLKNRNETTIRPSNPTNGHVPWETKKKEKLLSHVWLFVTPWTVAYQAPLSMGFSRQEYWSGLLFPSPGDLPDPGIKPRSPTLQADALLSETPGKPEKTIIQKGTCTPVFTVALFTTARTWKQPRCPSIGKYILKLWYIYTTEYYSAMKRNQSWVS